MTSAKKPKPETVRKLFKFTLIDEEKKSRAMEAAQLGQQLEDLGRKHEQLKTQAKSLAEEMEEIRIEQSRLHRIARTGKEEREEEAVVRIDYEAKLVQYLVKGEIIEERAATDNDLQLKIDVDKKKTAAQGRAADARKAEASKKKGASSDVANVIKDETSRKSKRSAVDGVYAG